MKIISFLLALCLTFFSQIGISQCFEPIQCPLSGPSVSQRPSSNTAYDGIIGVSFGLYCADLIGKPYSFTLINDKGEIYQRSGTLENNPYVSGSGFYITGVRVENLPAGTYNGSYSVAGCGGNYEELKLTPLGIIWFHDADGDGYNSSTMTSITQPPGSGWSVNPGLGIGDCDDQNPGIHPATIWYLDADNDGYYTGPGIKQCLSPGPNYKYAGIIASGDCNDDPTKDPLAATIYPGAIVPNCQSSLVEVRRIVATKGAFCEDAIQVELAFSSKLCFSNWNLFEPTVALMGYTGAWNATKDQTIIASLPAPKSSQDTYHFLAISDADPNLTCVARYDITALPTKGCDGVVSSSLVTPLSSSGARDAAFEFSLTTSSCLPAPWYVVLTSSNTGEAFGALNESTNEKITISGLPAGVYKLLVSYVNTYCTYESTVTVPEPCVDLEKFINNITPQVKSLLEEALGNGAVTMLSAAISSCISGNRNACTNRINAFVNLLRANIGRTISITQAIQLITEINAIVTAINNGANICGNTASNARRRTATQEETVPLPSKQILFPNPASQVINLTLNRDEENVRIALFDANGRLVKQIDKQRIVRGETTKINVESVASGLSLVLVQTNNNVLLADKIVIRH